MRVITGTARGRKLRDLPGLDTRPTTDKVKESMFNIVQFDVEGRKVLDLFSGTGQLGIEALSRGAASCVFVDSSRGAARVIEENLRLTGLDGRARVVQGDALGFLGACRDKFALAFLDPPYDSLLLEQALFRMAEIDIMQENGIIVCESAAGASLPALRDPYARGREYRYGKIKLTIYQRSAAPAGRP